MIGDPVLSREAATSAASRVSERLEEARRARLVTARHALMLAALEDSWARPWRRWLRRRALARVTRQLEGPDGKS